MKYHSGFISLLVTLVLVSVSGFAQTECNITLRGKVIDADTGEPLGYSNIVIIDIQKGTSTDEKGNFFIDGICAATYTIRVSHLTCESKEVIFSITGDTVLNFELPHRHNELLEVCITDEKKEEISTVAYQEISGKNLDKTRGESLAGSLEQMAGISAIKTGSSVAKPVIHGMYGSRVLVLNNGIRQEGQQWGSEHAPEIDPFIAKRITVIKGANSVRYGSDAIGGVILVEPEVLPNTPGISGELNLAGFSNNREGIISAIVEQNFTRLQPLSWRLQGTLKKGGYIKTPDYYLANTGYREQNFSAAMGWNKTRYGGEIFYSQFNNQIGIFSGSHIGNLTDLEAAFTRPEPLEQPDFSYKIERPNQNVEHELTKGRVWMLTGDAGKLSATYARQYNLRFEFDKEGPLNDSLAALNKPDLSYEITTHSLDLVWEHNNIGNLQGSIGVSGTSQANTFDGRMFIPNYENKTAGIFWIERWKKNKLQVETGLRCDIRNLIVYMRKSGVVESSEFNYNQFSGTAGMIYDFNPHARFSFNAGSAWRPPGVNELYSNGLHHGAAAIEIGDPTLTEEKAINLVAAINVHDHKRYKAEASVYYNYINDFIYLQPVLPPTLTIRGAFPTFRYRQANATISGIDAMGSYFLTTNVEVHVKLAIVRAFNMEEDEFLPLIPPDQFNYGLTWRKLVWKKSRDIYAGFSFRQVLHQSRVPDEADYLPPPPAFLLIDAEAGAEFKLGKQIFVLSLTATNLLNTNYRDYLNRYRYFADDEGRNIGIKLKVPFGWDRSKI